MVERRFELVGHCRSVPTGFAENIVITRFDGGSDLVVECLFVVKEEVDRESRIELEKIVLGEFVEGKFFAASFLVSLL